MSSRRLFQPFAALLIIFFIRAHAAAAGPPSPAQVGGEVVSDGKYLANNLTGDAISIVTSPLHIGEAGELLTSPKFYLVLGGAGALWGGSFALDQTMRSHLRGMSSSTADLLQNVSYGGVAAATAALYGYGLYAGDARAREYALTAGEGAGIATLVDIGIKDAFGRLRPKQDGHDHDAFFHGGQSFVSGDVTPMFALAAGVSEYFHNDWRVAVPVYSLALLDGFGRMGHDAHWFSDVVGAALLGAGTTELFIWLHKRHQENPNSFRIFPISPPSVAGPHAANNLMPAGVAFAYSW
ncbi:MAG: phosphatase PAP2 family protein [Candidatus Binataceae bacterium]